MNIIYLHTHDTGRYIEPYGFAVPTPNLQTLASEGMMFRQAFSTAPTCSPSRAGLLTGTAPHSCGMLGLAHRGFQLRDYDQHLVRFLKGQGYTTALCGVQHEAPQAELIGYDTILDMDHPKLDPKLRRSAPGPLDRSQRDLRNAQYAADYVRRAPDDTPFFLAFGMFNTHREFPDLDGTVNPNYVRPPHPLPDTEATRRDFATYIQAARVVDECVGLVLQALAETGRDQDTIVVFTTDHGLALPNMKCTLWDTGIGVSLLLRYPGQQSAGLACDALVSHLDVFPTLCDLAELPKPDWLQGTSLLPLLNGEAQEVRDAIFAEVSWHAAFEPQRAVRTQRYKYIRRFQGVTHVVPANIDDSWSKDVLLEHDLLETPRPEEALYDVMLDPTERVNLAYLPKHEDVRRQLATALEQWMEITDDPLCSGALERPAGAVINRQNCISPSEESFE